MPLFGGGVLSFFSPDLRRLVLHSALRFASEQSHTYEISSYVTRTRILTTYANSVRSNAPENGTSGGETVKSNYIEQW